MESFKIMCHKYPSLKIKVKSKFYYFNLIEILKVLINYLIIEEMNLLMTQMN